MNFIDWGLINYKEAWDKQAAIFNQIQDDKKNNLSPLGEIVFCEHPHVFTLGKNGNISNFLISEDILKKINAEFFKIDRGGDITYHGQGQLVGYPIINLEAYELSLKSYIYTLEEIIIKTLADFGISAERLNGATGVWIESETSAARKICAIGVKASRYVTMHGFALNVNTNLQYYSYINPCGFIDKGVTSMEKELGKKVDMDLVKETMRKYFAQLLVVNQ